ncbi:HEPN domain-containing protein [Variovorax sp. LT1P1]|uniref:HEPN domain-containing protein n=1 Tax=Variovorax sp. LT1P1 TaxID=3443730 RepID=UPI003F4939A8
MRGKLDEELRRFHNPPADKTRKLFQDYLEVDVTAGWKWQHHDPTTARKTLDDLLSKRGDAVHRSRAAVPGMPPAPHLLKRDDLEKAIRFLKGLVEATDRTLDDH